MMAEQEIRVGQIWRRKKSGKHIRIVAQRRDYFGSSDDWSWEGHDYKGKGASFGSYIRRDCELVEDPDTRSETVTSISSAEANSLSEGSVVLLTSDSGTVQGAAVRKRFPDRGPHANSLGWVLTDADPRDLDLVAEYPLDEDMSVWSAYPNVTQIVTPAPDIDADDFDDWCEQTEGRLSATPEGTVLVTKPDNAFLGVSAGAGQWKLLGCVWRSDEKAATWLSSSHLIVLAR